MELIGKKVRGFKFENEYLDYISGMNEYVGKIGEISYSFADKKRYTVGFEDGTYWDYPAELIEEHLVEETTVPETITLPLINGVPDLSEFEGVEMWVSDGEENWYTEKVLVYDSKCVYPYISSDDRFRYAKPLPEKKKITEEDV